MIKQLDSETADVDLTSSVTVLTHTPSATASMLCQLVVELGTASKPLDGTGGSFELVLTVGGQTVQPSPTTITFSTATQASYQSALFAVPANQAVVAAFKSPNASDTDVTVTARLMSVQPLTFGTDNGALISTDSQDLSGSLSVDAAALSGSTAAADALEAAIDTTDNVVAANVTQVSDSADAADALEAAIDTADNVIAANVTQVSDSADAADSLEIAAAVLVNESSQDLSTNVITVRNLADSADLYTVTITNDGSTIDRSITSA